MEGICIKESNYDKEHDSSIFEVSENQISGLKVFMLFTLFTLVSRLQFQGHNHGFPKFCAEIRSRGLRNVDFYNISHKVMYFDGWRSLGMRDLIANAMVCNDNENFSSQKCVNSSLSKIKFFQQTNLLHRRFACNIKG